MTLTRIVIRESDWPKEGRPELVNITGFICKIFSTHEKLVRNLTTDGENYTIRRFKYTFM